MLVTAEVGLGHLPVLAKRDQDPALSGLIMSHSVRAGYFPFPLNRAGGWRS
jgi:hypothetical protein